MIRGLAILAALLFFPTAAHATGPLCCGGGGGSSSTTFDLIGSGTNTSATMVVGTGGSLATSGSGTIAATTAAALAANGTNCAAGQAPLGVDASGNAESCAAFAPIAAKYITQTTDATLSAEQSLGALTTGLLLNTASAGTGVLSQYAGTSCTNQFPRSLNASGAATCATVVLGTDTSGAAPTATALAANPTDCGANTYATTIDASGNLTCASITNASTTGTALNTPSTLVLRDGSGNFAAGTITAALSGNASTATALAANPTDCSANQFATTIAASGNLTCAQPAFTDLSGTASAAQVPKINAASCTSGVQTASDGTVSCMTAASTPEFVARVETAGGTIQAYGVVAANGSNDDEVIEAATTATQILGCSQSGSSVTSTNPVTVAVAGVARCSTDASVVAGSLVKLGASGQFALATTADKTWGRALTDSTGASGTAYILLFDGAEGYIDHALDIWPSIPDLTTNVVNMVNLSPAVDISGAGTLRAVYVAPTSTIATSAVTGVQFAPAISASSLDTISALTMSGTVTQTALLASTFAGVAYPVSHVTTYTSATAGVHPRDNVLAIREAPAISHSATSGTATMPEHASVFHDPTISRTGAGTFVVSADYGIDMKGTYTESAGTLQVTKRAAVKHRDVTNTSNATAISENGAVDVDNLSTTAATTVYALQSAITSGTGKYFLNDTGGAQSSLVGKFTKYNNVTADTNHSGVPLTAYSASATAQGANIASTNVTASATAGRYQVCSMVTVTRAGTTSTMPSSSISWTDVTDSNVKTMQVTATSTANTTGTVDSNCILADVKGSTAITYSTTGWASTGGTSMQYKIYITATLL